MKKRNLFCLLLISLFIINNAKGQYRRTNAQIVEPVKWLLSSKKISDCEYELIFTAVIEEGWHVYSLTMKGGEGPNPARIIIDQSPNYELMGPATEDKPIKTFDKVFEMQVAYFEKTVIFRQRIKLKAAKEVIIKGKYEYQVCTEEKCMFPPPTPFEFKLSCMKKSGVKLIPLEIE
jgi:hypothetical protein